MLVYLFLENNNILNYYAFYTFWILQLNTVLNTTHSFGLFHCLHIPSYRFLLIFKRHPELFQFRWDRRARQLQSFEDVPSIASLVFCDECIGKALKRKEMMVKKWMENTPSTTTPPQYNLVACSACASSPVDVVFIVVWAVVVDDQNQLFDIQASGRHGGGHHQATSSVLKVVDDAVSVVLINSWKG